ncbi:MAG: OsmC family protein [Candidatus Velthaea sp.]|jgi:osmotically inducible protein OsmC
MAIDRHAEARWTGDIPTGSGAITFKSGALPVTPYSFATRFGGQPGTNPEELLAASHAACYSMALTFLLANSGHKSNSIDTQATATVDQVGAGFKITRVRLQVTGDVPGLTQEQFAGFARQAEGGCPISNAIRNNVEIVLEPTLK